MDRMALAKEFIQYSHEFRRQSFQRDFDEAMKGELFVIFYVLYKKNGVSAKEIKEKMDVSSARVAAILKSLEKKELIQRVENPEDRRMIKVNLTDKGRILAKETQDDVLNHILQIVDFLGADDAKELVRIMGRLTTLMQEG